MSKPLDLKYLTTASCEETEHWNPADFDKLGLDYDRRHNYPLTQKEVNYIGDGMEGRTGTTIINGYTVLFKERKFFAPTIELPFNPPEREECLKDIQDIAGRCNEALKNMGYIQIIEDDGPDEDRHTITALIPMDYVIDRLKFSAKEYNQWLANFFG